MKINFVNNTGGGFRGEMEVAEGTTIEQFFHQQMGEDKSFGDYGITINSLECNPSRTLRDGDTVSMVPGKYSGA
jgi:hypothetical protein